MIADLFSRFERVSGAKLNINKTTSIDVGFIDGDPITVPWLQTVNTVKVLGVIFANSIRLMITLNWDALVAKFAQQIWLHTMRSLTLHQKVTLLNTFVTAKIWYIASILPPYCVHTGKITATMGSFLWRGIPARVPMQQLARPREQGGLKLQLPAYKCKSMLINRHILEIESIPFYKSFIFQDNPNPVNPPTTLPCLKTIWRNYPQLPIQIQQNPSSDRIHCYYLQQTDRPRVERKYPNANWQRIWRNISAKQLTAAERAGLYLLVNEKAEYRQLMHTIRQANDETCTHCDAPIETIRHKFSECPRVSAAWRFTQLKIAAVLNGWRRITFEELLRPSLENIGPVRRNKILKIFINYITFVNQCNDRVDVQALNFHLDCVV